MLYFIQNGVEVHEKRSAAKFKPSVLTPKDNEAAQISVAKAVSAAAERSRTRGQYNAYSNEQRAKIGSMQWRMVQLMRQNTTLQLGGLKSMSRWQGGLKTGICKKVERRDFGAEQVTS